MNRIVMMVTTSKRDMNVRRALNAGLPPVGRIPTPQNIQRDIGYYTLAKRSGLVKGVDTSQSDHAEVDSQIG
jgi:hypothetical protein